MGIASASKWVWSYPLNLRFICVLPTTLFALALAAVVRLLWGARWGWEQGVLVVYLANDSWPLRTWYRNWGGTTIGHAMMINGSRMNDPTWIVRIMQHERTHVAQFETWGLCAAVVAIGLLAVSWQAALVLWVLLPALSYLAGMLRAVLVGSPAYRGNPYEMAAYDRVAASKVV